MCQHVSSILAINGRVGLEVRQVWPLLVPHQKKLRSGGGQPSEGGQREAEGKPRGGETGVAK